jgi:hypothetical protein
MAADVRLEQRKVPPRVAASAAIRLPRPDVFLIQ